MICAKDGCDTEFEPTHHRQKYCPPHKTPPNAKRYRYLREALEAQDPDHPQLVEAKLDNRHEGHRECARYGCKKQLKGKRRKYCSRECQQAVANKRTTLRKREERILQQAAEGVEPPEHSRRGDAYNAMVDGIGEEILHGNLTQTAAAEMLGLSKAAVSRGYEAFLWEHGQEKAKEAWQMPRLTAAQLPRAELAEFRKLGKTKEGRESARFEELHHHLIRAHITFARRWCQLEGERVIYKPFHVEWVGDLLLALATGGKKLILSPPRHGKSELLIRYVLWLIIMDPNLRFMWVCANTDVAKLMLGAVKDYLANHTELIRHTLPPGETYKPAHGSGRPWSTKEIKVNQQSHVGAKSSSLLALGRTSKILSRDVDVLMVDDIEDFDSTRESSQREYSRQKFAEIGTRKMRWTCQVYIGSRNHAEDVPNHIIKTGEKTRWSFTVLSAHDEDCMKDPNEWDEHTDCMLFPEINDYQWLMEKKIEMEDLGLPGAFEMRYLNRPRPTEGLVFDMEKIRANSLDRSRGIGLDSLPPGKLIAGLDPSSRNMQAAVLWHYAEGFMNIVDIETQEAGGFAGALSVMERWHQEYDLRDWVYEDNSQQHEFFRDPRLIEIKRNLGLSVKPHTTGKNKQDPELGISSMAPWFHDGTITLPYGTDDARRKVRVLLRQLESWTTDGVARGKGMTDVKMATWFPFPRLVRWAKVDRTQKSIRPAREASYPSIKHLSNFPTTRYPRTRR